jgi:hypothetical protein
MPLSDAQRLELLAALEKIGWHYKEQFIYAPNETMWLLVSCPWTEDLPDFFERMKGRLSRIQNNKGSPAAIVEYQKGVDDVTGLIEVLRKMVS